jgi:hypothetical protein
VDKYPLPRPFSPSWNRCHFSDVAGYEIMNTLRGVDMALVFDKNIGVGY